MALLELSRVGKRYGADRPAAVDDLTLSLEAGRILALLGPSGCGKTTTLRLIAGFEVPDAGEIAIGGRVVARAGHAGVPPEERSVGVVFQDYALFPHLTVEANVAFGVSRRPRAERRARVARMLDLVGLTWAGAILTSCPAVSSSEWRPLGRWRRRRRCSCSTSPSRISTPTCARRCGTRSRRS
jgi:iron(III) transport system ATP-binding protein